MKLARISPCCSRSSSHSLPRTSLLRPGTALTRWASASTTVGASLFPRAHVTENAQPRTPAGPPSIPVAIFIRQGAPHAHGPFFRHAWHGLCSLTGGVNLEGGGCIMAKGRQVYGEVENRTDLE